MSTEAITQGSVHTSIVDSIATVTFSHPLSNSLPGNLLRELAAAITEAGQAEGVRAVVLRSEGSKAFCAGASFDELASISGLEEGKLFFSGFAGVINAMRKVPVPVLCRVQGKAVGGGVGLAAAADVTYALDSAFIKLSELAVGIGPFVVGPAVQRKVGVSAFTQLTLDATVWKSAAWAREKGLYAETFGTLEELDKELAAFAQRLAASSPEALAMLKRVFWEGTDHWDTLLTERAEMSGRLVLSDYSRSAIARFKQGAR